MENALIKTETVNLILRYIRIARTALLALETVVASLGGDQTQAGE